MVTTFNARLLHLANRCTPIVGSHNKRNHEDTQTQGQGSNKTTVDTSTNTNNMKRSSDYYYAYTHHRGASANSITSNGTSIGGHGNSSDTHGQSSNKRRRQQYAELQYTAATIQNAFADSIIAPRNRRERALTLGNVDTESARVMTSAEFDADLDNDIDDIGIDENDHKESSIKKQDDEEFVITSRRNKRSSTSNNSNDGYGDLASMYMLSGLIQSTRNFYSFSTSEDTGTTTSSMIAISNGKSNKLPSDMTTQSYYNANCNEDEKFSEDTNSEGLSSWTPSSSYNDVLSADKSLSKNIDNDNRSDEQSIIDDMGDVGTGTEDSIYSSDDMASPSQQQPYKGDDGESVETRRESCASIDAPFSIIG